MSQGFQRFTKRYVNVLGVLIGLTVVSSILIYSGCGMTSSPNIPTNPTPTPDTVRPTSIITSPTTGGIVSTGATVNITGTASDTGGGTVQSVQVSVDGGVTWNPATGTSAWSFAWSPTLAGPATIKSRALDTSGNQQDPPAEVTVTVRDATPPTSTITSPKEGAIVPIGTQVAITGTASDAGGGSVVKVEVSVDGGANYSAATGTNAWSFNWTPSAPGPVTIKSRAVDNSGNVQNPPAEIHVTVDAPPTSTITFPTEGATADNNATSTSFGSGIFAEGSDVRTELTNNIIVAKPGQTGLYCGNLSGQNQAIRFNNIFSSGGMAYGGTCSNKTGTDGNISADPLFINPTQGDYHLQQGSPSIDSGANLTPNLPDTDIDGEPRILDGDGNGTAIVDMGVDEFLVPPSAVWNFSSRILDPC